MVLTRTDSQTTVNKNRRHLYFGFNFDFGLLYFLDLLVVGASKMVSTIEATASYTKFLFFGFGASKMVSTIEATASFFQF